MLPLTPSEAAKMLLEQHGLETEAHVIQRHAEMTAIGDKPGTAVWKKILEEVQQLRQRQTE